MVRHFFYLMFTSLVATGTVFCQSNDSLVLRKMFDGKVELLMPASYRQLTTEEITQRFPNQQLSPTEMWAEEDGSSSIKLVQINQALTDKQIPEYRTFHVSRMKNTPNQEWITDGVTKINGRNVGYVKVIYTALKTYSHFFFVSINNKLVLFAFNSFDTLRSSKEPLGDKVANSLRIIE